MLAASLLYLTLGRPQGYGTLGRSQTDIIKMGRVKWLKIYEKEAGLSNQAMIAAQGSWAEAEEPENDRLAKALGPKGTSFFKELRSDLFDYSSNVVEVGRALSGGGTMWQLITAIQAADREDAIYAVLTKKRVGKLVVVSKVTKQLDKLEKLLKEGKGDLQPEYGSYSKPVGELKLARAAYGRVVKRAAKLTTSGSNAVLGFCSDVVANSLELGG